MSFSGLQSVPRPLRPQLGLGFRLRLWFGRLKRKAGLCQTRRCWRLERAFEPRNSREWAMDIRGYCSAHGRAAANRNKRSRDLNGAAHYLQRVARGPDKIGFAAAAARMPEVQCAGCTELVVGDDRVTFGLRGIWHPECLKEAQKDPGFWKD